MGLGLSFGKSGVWSLEGEIEVCQWALQSRIPRSRAATRARPMRAAAVLGARALWSHEAGRPIELKLDNDLDIKYANWKDI